MVASFGQDMIAPPCLRFPRCPAESMRKVRNHRMTSFSSQETSRLREELLGPSANDRIRLRLEPGPRLSGRGSAEDDRNLQPSAPLEDFHRYLVGMTAYHEIDARLLSRRLRSTTQSRNAGRRGLCKRISFATGSNCNPSEASINVNGVALAQACGEHATGYASARDHGRAGNRRTAPATVAGPCKSQRRTCL